MTRRGLASFRERGLHTIPIERKAVRLRYVKDRWAFAEEMERVVAKGLPS